MKKLMVRGCFRFSKVALADDNITQERIDKALKDAIEQIKQEIDDGDSEDSGVPIIFDTAELTCRLPEDIVREDPLPQD